MQTLGVSVIRACALASFRGVRWCQSSSRKDQVAFRLRIRKFAMPRPRFGFPRIWVLLRRAGWLVSVMRVRRLYRLEGLEIL